jgi:EAL domain-containing protein (putative c-di-GMP-specific phosphodiesterase class I)
VAADAEHDTSTNGDRGLADELARALAGHQFLLLYQPTIDLKDDSFVGVEALLRWQHPTRGTIGPDEFLPVLEATGQINAVGSWVLTTACRQGADWYSRGYRFSVSVNVSRQQLAQPSLPTDVARALAESSFDPRYLVLEFSEHTLAGGSEVRAHLGRLKETGVRLAIDDFGMEPGSAALLETLPIDIVKIDRTFVSDLSTSTSHAARVHQLAQLGRLEHVQTVAQGIEDDDQRLRLRNENVDVGQGFLFSVPHDAEAIDRFLEDYAIFSGKPL